MYKLNQIIVNKKRYSPVGILFLVAANIIRIDNMADTAKRLSLYMITVILGLIFHSMVSIQLIYFLATKKNPFIFLKGMLQVNPKFQIKFDQFKF